jgi:CheY-like chemotaxis protein
VEDDEQVASLLSRILRRAGLSVATVGTGGLALHSPRKLHPDLILLDADLPDLSGFQVCTQLKADSELRAMPVIFCEVLNPKGDCISMVARALATKYPSEAKVVAAYHDAAWSRWTYEVLRHGIEQHSGAGFIAWPDTGRAWAAHWPIMPCV